MKTKNIMTTYPKRAQKTMNDRDGRCDDAKTKMQTLTTPATKTHYMMQHQKCAKPHQAEPEKLWSTYETELSTKECRKRKPG